MSARVATAAPESSRRSTVMGIVFLAVGALIILWWGFGTKSGVDTRFQLNPSGLETARESTYFHLPDVVVPSQATLFVIGALCAFAGGYQLAKGFGRRVNLALGLVAFLLVMGFLTWAAADGSLSLLGMLQSTVLRSVPIAFAALSGVLCERSGVINIGIEGMLLSGAFAGAVAASVTHNLWLGLLAGALVGGLIAAGLALLAIRYLVDQIVAGTVVNILALGMTGYLSKQYLENSQTLNDPGRFQNISIPVLSKIPVLGPVLFDNNIFVYLLFAIIAATTVGLYYTRWGLRVRAVGEHPVAADTVGVRVLFTRYRSVILGGIVAGIGGAYFTLGAVGRFEEGMSAGRGFIGLAAMIFGRWNPLGAFAAALIFGFADSLQVKASILQVDIPNEFLAMLPYLVTILIVAGAAHRVRPPAADGKPYIKQR
jgi:general nucleoside transport system permease protein